MSLVYTAPLFIHVLTILLAYLITYYILLLCPAKRSQWNTLHFNCKIII